MRTTDKHGGDDEAWWGVWVGGGFVHAHWVQASFRGVPMAWTEDDEDAARYPQAEADTVLALLAQHLPPEVPRGRTVLIQAVT